MGEKLKEEHHIGTEDGLTAMILQATLGTLQTMRKVIEIQHQEFEEARQAGFTVYNYKGYTNYAIALAATAIIEAIVDDSRRIYPVSTLIDGYLGVNDICLSIPAVIGREGILLTLELELDETERNAFLKSAEVLKNFADSLGI